MKKKVFLDTSVLLRMLSGQPELHELFSQQLLDRVTYITSPVAYQELLLAVDKIDSKGTLDELNRHVEPIALDFESMKSDISFRDDLRKFRNLAVHTNDVLIIRTAEESDADYFLTYDPDLVRILTDKAEEFQVMSPEVFLESIRQKQ